MEQLERNLATVRVTLEPTMQPSRFAVWITTEQATELYGVANSRMEAATLCREIAEALGVQRGMEV